MVVNQLVAIALGGALGAVLRHSVSSWVQLNSNSSFPWGTLTVNLVGCFFIGLLFQFFEFSPLSQNQRAFIFTGLLGAFTTFSTYGLDIVKLIQAGNLSSALLKLAASNGVGILLVFVGIGFGRAIVNTFNIGS